MTRKIIDCRSSPFRHAVVSYT